MKLKLVNGGTQGSEIELSDATFGREFNEPLVHQVLTAYAAAGRAGTKAQLTKAEVRGGGKKPWNQKGTGQARAGSDLARIRRERGLVFLRRRDQAEIAATVDLRLGLPDERRGVNARRRDASGPGRSATERRKQQRDHRSAERERNPCGCHCPSLLIQSLRSSLSRRSRKYPTSVTRPIACMVPRFPSFTGTDSVMSTQTVRTATGSRFPTAIA